MKNQNQNRRDVKGNVIDEILHVPIGTLSKYSPDKLHILLNEAEDDLGRCRRAKKWIESAISFKYEAHMRYQRQYLGKSTGIVHIEDDGYKVTHDLAKKVVWDQKELKKVMAKLILQGVNVDEYITTTYNVLERKYKGWSALLKDMFQDARCVGVSSSTYKIEKISKKAEKNISSNNFSSEVSHEQ